MHLRMSSAKWRPLCPGWDELIIFEFSHYSATESQVGYSVPQNRDPDIDVLDLSYIPIPLIDSTSFIRYRNISELIMRWCSLVYVKNGTFHLLWKLELLNFQFNLIAEFPAEFRLASKSITELQLWDAFTLRALSPFCFRNFSNLKKMNIGKNDWSLGFDTNTLPENLPFINLDKGGGC